MFLKPRTISTGSLSEEELKIDKDAAERYEDCGVGQKALYLGAYGLHCIQYIPHKNIRRVFKRLAVSKGFFEEGKIFGSISYLVIHYDEDKEKVFRFTHEEQLDALLGDMAKKTNVIIGKP